MKSLVTTELCPKAKFREDILYICLFLGILNFKVTKIYGGHTEYLSLCLQKLSPL